VPARRQSFDQAAESTHTCHPEPARDLGGGKVGRAWCLERPCLRSGSGPGALAPPARLGCEPCRRRPRLGSLRRRPGVHSHRPCQLGSLNRAPAREPPARTLGEGGDLETRSRETPWAVSGAVGRDRIPPRLRSSARSPELRPDRRINPHSSSRACEGSGRGKGTAGVVVRVDEPPARTFGDRRWEMPVGRVGPLRFVTARSARRNPRRAATPPRCRRSRPGSRPFRRSTRTR
jgi:hypothetical protein